MEGTCLCKVVCVKITDDNLFGSQRRGHLCHCVNCRKVAGGLYGANLTIETGKIQITGEDNIMRYDDPETSSGTPVQRYFCKARGILPAPEWKSFLMDMQEWEMPLDGTMQFKKQSYGEKVDGSPEKSATLDPRN
ncbi:MAG: hypothetical protein M1834_006637 [Cirrosporium novae-zelandiae]|nr:MAG: hypothetical protein M1834_006637 [Cirrosporium novae-zelandiae]